MPIKNEDLYVKLEGHYYGKKGTTKISLFIAGPNTSKKNFGEYFTYSKEHFHEKGGGMQEIIFGNYEILQNKIILIGKRRSQESWISEDVAEGEAFIEEYRDGELNGEIDWESLTIKLENQILQYRSNS